MTNRGRSAQSKPPGGVAPSWCPACGHVVDSATSIGGKTQPKPGDVGVCLYCAAYLEYDELLTTTVLADTAFEELPDATKALLRRARELIRSGAI